MSKTIIALLTLIGAQFVPMEELSKVMEALSILAIWFFRYQAGDISLMGLRK